MTNTLEQRARELVAKWRATADGFAALGGDISTAEAASMRNDANELEAALRLPAGEDWQPIETPPNDAPAHSIGVLVYCPSHGVLNGWYTGFYADNGKFPWSAINTTERPTHWQPLPAAPRHETGE